MALLLVACKPGGAEQPRAFSSSAADRHFARAAVGPMGGTPAPASIDASSEVDAALAKVRHAQSYRGRMRGLLGPEPTLIEYVAPDRYRMRMGPEVATTIIGTTVYLTMNGKTTRSARDPSMPDLSSMGLKALRTAKIEALGQDMLAGQPTRVYRFELPDSAPGRSTLWIASNSGYPVRIQTRTRMGAKTVDVDTTYSDFNDPSIKVDAPASK